MRTNAFGDGRSLRSISAHDLRRRLKSLQSLALDEVTQEQVDERVRRLLDMFPHSALECGMSGVYRARVNNGAVPFEHRSELWSPPAEKARAGRLNAAGQPVFYCATDARTAILEVRPLPGQTVTVAFCRATNGVAQLLDCFFIGIAASRDGDVTQVHPDVIAARRRIEQVLGKGSYRKYVQIDNWMRDEVTKDVPSGAVELYKPTISLGRLLFTSPIQAISYPSVASKRNGTNLCLRTSDAAGWFEPSEVWMLQVEEVSQPTGGGSVAAIRPVRRGRLADQATGAIEWLPAGSGLGDRQFETFSRNSLVQLGG